MGATDVKGTNGNKAREQKASGIDWAALGAQNGSGSVTWADADPTATLALIHAATRRGMGVSFSATASGTGVSITFLDGGNRPKRYANSIDELLVLVDTLAEALR